MKKDYKKELDKLEWKDRYKIILAVTLFFLISITTISVGLFKYSGKINNVTGIVTGVSGGYGRSGATYLLVKLENGKIVEALLPDLGIVKHNGVVIIEEMKNVFGFKRYFFKEYVEEKEHIINKIAF